MSELQTQITEEPGNTKIPSVDRAQMQMVIVGHVDHGKSTIIGRLLADTGTLPDGKLDAVRAACDRNSKPFEYAFLIDALKDEQAQGITIDSARVFFKTPARDYIIIDAPGHIEFLKNMVTGASRAEVAFLVIDAHEGIQENSRRHGYLLSMLGVRQLAVIVNKMDLVDYDRTVFRRIVRRYRRFLRSIDIDTDHVEFIPVSGMLGDNVVTRSPNMQWYEGPTVVKQLDSFRKEADLTELPFRMPVQGVYKFTKFGDARRIIAGTIGTGRLHEGDEVVFYPSGKRSKVRGFERFAAPESDVAIAPNAVGFTLSQQIYVTRGEIAARADERPPTVSNRVRVNLFWLGHEPMRPGKEYVFKMGSSRYPVRIHRVVRVLDASSLKANRRKDVIERHDVAEVELAFASDIAFDPVDRIPFTSRFVIVDDYEIRGGGIIRGTAEDENAWMRENVRLRNFNWDRSTISPVSRAERYNQRSTLILITGEEHAGKQALANKIEEQLFLDGKFVYFLGVGNLKRGLSADIQEVPVGRDEHIRRLAEVSHLFLDAGAILIVTGVELTQEDLDLIKVPVNPDSIVTVWAGPRVTTDIDVSVHIADPADFGPASEQIKSALRRIGAIYSPY
ncbi:MAG: GTP-binding protein [Spirochaetota bacterium]